MLNENSYNVYDSSKYVNIYIVCTCTNEQTFIINSIIIYIYRWKLIFVHKTCLWYLQQKKVVTNICLINIMFPQYL